MGIQTSRIKDGIRIEGLEDVRSFSKGFERNVPFAMALALTRTAQVVKKAEEAEMYIAFDRPKPYTYKSLYIKAATKQKLQSRVYIKDEWATGKGTPASKYLYPEIHGTKRNLKRSEAALRANGILPPDRYIVPGKGVKLDQYGNIPASLIVQILSYFKAFGEQGYTANITAKGKVRKMRKGVAYFAITKPGGHLHPGIYFRASSAWGAPIKPILMFVKEPSYKPRYHFYEIGRKMADMVWQGIFSAAMDQAIRTAR